MKRLTFVLFAVLALLIVMPATTQAQWFSTLLVKTVAKVTGYMTVGDSLRVQGAFKVNGTFSATSKVFGIKAWQPKATSATNPDTLLISGVDSTWAVLVQPIAITTADTASTVQLFVIYNKSTTSGTGKLSDTVFVYQRGGSGTAAFRQLKYSYFAGKPSS